MTHSPFVQDHAEYWQKIKTLHRTYYQQRLQGKTEEALKTAEEMATTAFQLCLITKQDILKDTVNREN